MSEVMQHSSDLSTGITLTEAATRHILAFLAKQKESIGIRLSVKKTGCSGLSYVVDYINSSEETDRIQTINSTYSLFIDKSSYPYLKGLTMDYVKEGINQKFVFINPNQTGQCGCGESFTVE